jgi:hypothetical protein
VQGRRKKIRRGGKRLRDELEQASTVDWYKRMQPPRPTADTSCIDARNEQYWKYIEENGKVVGIWCKGVVVRVLKNKNEHIQWNTDYLQAGDNTVTKEIFLNMFWNKHRDEG